MTMNVIDIIIVAVIVAILGGAIFFLHRAKKKGIKCVGCPDSSTCSGSCGTCSGTCANCTEHK